MRAGGTTVITVATTVQQCFCVAVVGVRGESVWWENQCCSDLCYYNTGNYATIEDRTNG